MELVVMLKNRNQKGLSLLYDKYSFSLMGIIMSVVNHRETAEDILQETFLKVWDKIETFDETKGTIFTWMATIARRQSIDKVRLKSFNNSVGIEDEHTTELLTTTKNELKIDTATILNKIQNDQKKVIELLYLKGYTQQQVSEELKIPLGTVKSRLRLGIQKLREELKNEKNLLFSVVLLIIFTLWNLWI